MLLTELKTGQSATIKGFDVDNELGKRLLSFGLKKGTFVTLEAKSLAKATIKLRVQNSAALALRDSEACQIKVWTV